MAGNVVVVFGGAARRPPCASTYRVGRLSHKAPHVGCHPSLWQNPESVDHTHVGLLPLQYQRAAVG